MRWPLFLVVIAGCLPGPTSAPDMSVSPTVIVGEVRDTSGAPVSGVMINAAGVPAESDAAGVFMVEVPAQPGVVVGFLKDGFVESARRVDVLAGERSELSVTLISEAAGVALDSRAGGTVKGARGATLEAPANAFVDLTGAVVSGTVSVSLTPLSPLVQSELAAYPGDLVGIDAGGKTQRLRTFGALDVTVRQGKSRLALAKGATVSVTLPGAASEALPSSTGLWSFDLAAGVWRAEGTVARGSGSTYSARLSHLSFWNLDRADSDNTSCVTGVIFDSAGNVVAGAQVVATGIGYSGEVSYVTSAADGSYCVYVKSDALVDVVATQRGIEGSTQVATGAATGYGRTCPFSTGDCVYAPDITLGRSDGGAPACAVTSGGGRTDGGVANPFAGTCAAGLLDFYRCFVPTGGCSLSYSATGDGFELDFGDGAKEVWNVNGSISTGTCYGPTGVLCGTMTVIEGSDSVSLSTSQGRWQLTRDAVVCSDGTRVPVDGARGGMVNACGGAQSPSQCDTSNGLGKPCVTDGDCTGGVVETACCVANAGSVCLPAETCDTYQQMGCSDQAPCASSLCCNEPALGVSFCIPYVSECP